MPLRAGGALDELASRRLHGSALWQWDSRGCKGKQSARTKTAVWASRQSAGPVRLQWLHVAEVTCRFTQQALAPCHSYCRPPTGAARHRRPGVGSPCWSIVRVLTVVGLRPWDLCDSDFGDVLLSFGLDIWGKVVGHLSVEDCVAFAATCR